MRTPSLLVFALLVACDPASQDTDVDTDTDVASPVLTCASDPIRDSSWVATWRGTMDIDASAVDFVRGDLHPRDPGLGIEPRSLSAAATGTWTDEGLAVTGDAVTASLTWTPIGMLTGPATIESEATALTCWPEGFALPFRYEDGVCSDADGVVGRQVAPIAYFRETGLGMCTDFEAQAIEEGDLSYPEWFGPDLRGADLSGANMHFALFTDARFEGTQLDGFDFGYVIMNGTIDAHTTLPPECIPDGATVQCMR